MTIEVMNRAPANNEGQLGEIRLIVSSNGMFLYVKGYGRWEILKMTNPSTVAQRDRDERTALQGKIRKVIEHDGTSGGGAAVHGRGVISGGGTIHGGSGPPSGSDVPL